jgi:DNA-binding transcriptional ArsR family regulator
MIKQSVPLDLVFKALADPTRREIVERLSGGSATVSELAAPFVITLPAVVQHLEVLEASGLVRTEKVGRVRTCRLDPEAIGRVEGWAAARRAGWERRLDRLGDVLAGTDRAAGPKHRPHGNRRSTP